MQEHGFGETNCFACQALEARPSGEMFAFALLGMDFADGLSRCGKMAVRDPCGIDVKVLSPKGLEQVLQLEKDFIRPTSAGLRQDDSGERSNRVPPPPLGGFAPHTTPYLIDLGGLNSANFHRKCVRTTPLTHRVVHR